MCHQSGTAIPVQICACWDARPLMMWTQAGWPTTVDDEAALKRQIMQRLIAQGEKPTPMIVGKMARTITSKREIEQTLNMIRQAGSQVEYVSVDVTDGAHALGRWR